MKYKAGDKVKLKSKEGLDELKRQVGDLYVHPDAYKNAGSEQTILECNDGFYRYDASSKFWHESLFEGLVEDEEIEFTEEDKYWCDIMSESDPTTYVLPQGYQFVDENGNVINATKIVLEKKKKDVSLTQEQIDTMVHESCVLFCKHCGCGVPRDTCTSLGTCKEHDEYRTAIRTHLMNKYKD